MTVSFPRISITVNDGKGAGTQGDLKALSFGFSLHQTWIYCVLFGAAGVFQPNDAATMLPHVPLASVAFAATFALILIFTAITDQKLLRFYTARPIMVASAILASLGTLLLFATSAMMENDSLSIVAGAIMGAGSAALTMFWGTAYSREGTTSIVVNAAIAIVVAIASYSVILHLIPYPFSGIATAALPLLELPLLWQFTPLSYTLRHVVPIFNPLPIKKGPFMLRFGLPILLFGVVLGTMRTVSLQIILPSSDPTTQLLTLFAGGAVTVVLIVAAFSVDKRSHWDFLFRPIVPLVAATLFFLPGLEAGDTLAPSLALMTGYMCLETLMWVFFGQLSQEFRLSPVCMFGTGCGALAIGSYAGSLMAADPAILHSLTPFGGVGGILVLTFALMLGNALLPRVRDIKRIVIPHGEKGSDAKNEDIAALNQETEQAIFNNMQGPAAWSIGLTKTLPLGPSDQQDDKAELIWPFIDRSDETPEQGAKTERGSDDPESRMRKSGRFRTQCEIIANRYLLSRRETEVMFLLARGYNAALIQDKLCISKSTAKTHISHIYRKLDIHNQQELLAMVEETRDGSEGRTPPPISASASASGTRQTR